MAKAKNTFLASKMNKDIDARLLKPGEYRDAKNVQISRSEGDGVGSLENVLGNRLVANFEVLTGVSNLTCIGYFSDDINNNIYLFLTDYLDPSPINFVYNKDANNFIYSYNTVTKTATKLVQGPFLNFSKTNFIYGVNVLEDILFWTDNRNQPRRINILSAIENSSYYTTEDQISVATYNPYKAIQLFRESQLASGSTLKYETTMLDVTSKFYPNGGTADVIAPGTYTAGSDITLGNVVGNIYQPNSSGGSPLPGSLVKGSGNSTVPDGTTVETIGTYIGTTTPKLTLTDAIIIGPDTTDSELIFEPNPYYDESYNGDPNYLEDKFVRFSYRFVFDDNEKSIFATFTQPAFIPKQDGYFKLETPIFTSTEQDDQKQAYKSTIVEFMENKVNNIFLYIPLPFKNYELKEKLKVDSIDVLYKESNQTAVKVIEEISIDTITNSSAIAQIDGTTPGSATFNIDNVKGGIKVGALVSGGVIPYNVTVDSYTPTNPSNPNLGGLLVLSEIISGTLPDDFTITIGDPDFYIYEYQSRKPTKVLPESELIRVYDKTPVRALSQEVISNRVVYGNFEDKHTPPASLDYNVNASPKADFDTLEGFASVSTPVAGGNTTTVTGQKGSIWDSGVVIGCVVTTNAVGADIPEGTIVVAYDGTNGQITFNNNVTLSLFDLIFLVPGSDTQASTSLIEYPNHSLKQNRNYQVGFVLSDRYGRQSSTILSSSLSSVVVNSTEFIGSTIFSPYNSLGDITNSTWPGDSLKISFNNIISPKTKNTRTGWPGIYNGDSDSAEYNPLGWYSWKIVVKQTEQEYYNVYLPGIMASYPKDASKELGKTSHTVLINDNINKVPRDLSEVGPQQKQFRSSVKLYGRVENLDFSTGIENNSQYYPGIKADTVTIISTIDELFSFSVLEAERPDYFPQFYSFTSNPLIARITTQKQIGITADTGFVTASAAVDARNTPTLPTSRNDITLLDVQGSITLGMLVRGGGLAEGTTVTSILGLPNSVQVSATIGSGDASASVPNNSSIFEQGDILTFYEDPNTNPPSLQHLAVYETEPVESLLDIFWETSSSGLISDLNDAVLYDNNGADTLIGFDTVNFTENISIGSQLNASPFGVGNIFGANLLNAGTDFNLFIDSCVDLNGNDRISDFSIQIDNVASGTFDLIAESMFVYNADPGDRTFYFTFKCVIPDPAGINPDVISFFEETVLLQNEIPVILGSYDTATSSYTDICSPEGYYLTEPDGVTPNPYLVTIDQLASVAVPQLRAENGSNFFTNGAATNEIFRSSEGLVWQKISEIKTPQFSFETEENLEEFQQQNNYEINTDNANLGSDSGDSNGVGYVQIIKTNPQRRGGSIIKLKLVDANGSDVSYNPIICRIVINAETAYVDKAWRVAMRTPKAIPDFTDPNFVIDAEATVDAVLFSNSFSIDNLVPINPLGNPTESQLDGYGFYWGIALTPIRAGSAIGNEFDGFGRMQVDSIVYGQQGEPNDKALCPNCRIYDKNTGALLGQVLDVTYTDIPAPIPDPLTGFPTNLGDQGPKANITTVNDIDLSGVTDLIFASGQWQVSNLNSHNSLCDFTMRPNTYTLFTFPYLIPGTNDVSSPSDWTYSDSLDFCTSGNPCACSSLELWDYQDPVNPLYIFGQDDNGILNSCAIVITGADFPNCSLTNVCNGENFGCSASDLDCP